MEEEGPSVRWAELSVQGAGEGLLASYGSGEAERPAAIISGLGLPSHLSGVAKCHVGKAQVNPGIILGESLVSEASMEFLASTFRCSPSPFRYIVPFYRCRQLGPSATKWWSRDLNPSRQPPGPTLLLFISLQDLS